MFFCGIIYVHPSVYEGIERIMSPWSASWFEWWLVAAVLLLATAQAATPHFLATRVQSLMSNKERQSIFADSSITDYRSIIAAALFTLLSYSITLYIFRYEPMPFTQQGLLLTIALVALWLALKLLLTALLFYIFFDLRQLLTMLPGIATIHLLTAIALTAAVAAELLLPPTWHHIARGCIAAVLLGSLITIVAKSIQNFLARPIDLFHIFSYLCTLEIIPLLALLKAFDFLQTALA